MFTELESPVTTSQTALNCVCGEKKYRACSFWFTWKYLNWPDKDIKDLLCARADAVAESGANLAIAFGTHFRWDFLPILGRVHEMLAFTVEQLHQRNVEFFDHHSSVLTHRPRNAAEQQDIWNRNRHHLPFYPHIEFVKTLQYNGSLLNDWRMIGIDDNRPIFIERYVCEQFCMNNPEFCDAYAAYLRQLVGDVHLDGVMSDDAVYYPGWKACGCKYCREKFRMCYDTELPAVDDASFWSNRENPGFRNWIKFRYETSKNFLMMVRKNLPEKISLMSCCSASDSITCNAAGMSAEDFAPSSDVMMLEMCGEVLDSEGKWASRVPTLMLQLAISREHKLPCLGLGYGFYRDSFNMIWAIDRFFGAEVWLSTLRGRLGIADSAVKNLPDESDICDECFRWDMQHEHLFQGEADADVTVIFSRPTRDYFARSDKECFAAYESICNLLFDARITFEVANRIPQFGDKRTIILPWAVCLSHDDRKQIGKFIAAGGAVVIVGCAGLKDETGNTSDDWLETFGISQKLIRSKFQNGWPVDVDSGNAKCECDGTFSDTGVKTGQWIKIAKSAGVLYWTPGLGGPEHHDEFIQKITSSISPELCVLQLPEQWYVRIYKADGRYLLHSIPSKVKAVSHPTLKNQFLGGQPIVREIDHQPIASQTLKVRFMGEVHSAFLYSLDIPIRREGKVKQYENYADVEFELAGIRRYMIAEIRVLGK